MKEPRPEVKGLVVKPSARQRDGSLAVVRSVTAVQWLMVGGGPNG